MLRIELLNDGKRINLNLYHNDDRIKIEYGIEINSKEPAYDDMGTDNVLFLGDEEKNTVSMDSIKIF